MKTLEDMKNVEKCLCEGGFNVENEVLIFEMMEFRVQSYFLRN